MYYIIIAHRCLIMTAALLLNQAYDIVSKWFRRVVGKVRSCSSVTAQSRQLRVPLLVELGSHFLTNEFFTSIVHSGWDILSSTSSYEQCDGICFW